MQKWTQRGVHGKNTGGTNQTARLMSLLAFSAVMTMLRADIKLYLQQCDRYVVCCPDPELLQHLGEAAKMSLSKFCVDEASANMVCS